MSNPRRGTVLNETIGLFSQIFVVVLFHSCCSVCSLFDIGFLDSCLRVFKITLTRMDSFLQLERKAGFGSETSLCPILLSFAKQIRFPLLHRLDFLARHIDLGELLLRAKASKAPVDVVFQQATSEVYFQFPLGSLCRIRLLLADYLKQINKHHFDSRFPVFAVKFNSILEEVMAKAQPVVQNVQELFLD